MTHAEEQHLQKGSAANLMGDTESDGLGPRAQLKTIADLGRFVEAGDQMNAVIGFFATDDENGIIGRNDTESAYGVFREASTKNKEASFGIVKNKELAAACGIRRFPIVLTFTYDEAAKQYEMRRTQFFDDKTIYINDDKTRMVGLLKKDGEESVKYVDLKPRRSGNKAAAEPEV
jgi:hypothetical protein